MTEPANEFQAAVYQQLIAWPALQVLCGDRIYDGDHDDDRVYPYVTFGPSDETPDDSECLQGGRFSIQIDSWCDQQGQKRIKQVMFAIRKALAGQTFDLPTHGMHDVQMTVSRVLPDPADVHHGVQQFEVDIDFAD